MPLVKEALLVQSVSTHIVTVAVVLVASSHVSVKIYWSFVAASKGVAVFVMAPAAEIANFGDPESSPSITK